MITQNLILAFLLSLLSFVALELHHSPTIGRDLSRHHETDGESGGTTTFTQFRYEVNGLTYAGESTSSVPIVIETLIGGNVPVDYATDHPALARIKGDSGVNWLGVISLVALLLQ